MTTEPTHPGTHLRTVVLPALSLNQSEAARMLGISAPTMHCMLHAKQGVTASMALRLGKMLGTSPIVWLNMQTEHDLWRARRALADKVDLIPTVTTTKPEVTTAP
jgi:addiction module HigA family antidote